MLDDVLLNATGKVNRVVLKRVAEARHGDTMQARAMRRTRQLLGHDYSPSVAAGGRRRGDLTSARLEWLVVT